jgi:AhpD family alkylhydroperoxidase
VDEPESTSLTVPSRNFFFAHRSHFPVVIRHDHDDTIREQGVIMQARMKNPLIAVPDALKALLAVDKATEAADLPYVMRKLVQLRASQINGCSVCVDMHSRELKKANEKDERIFMVAAWREAPYFTDAERAALALTEAATRLSDRADPVPDDVWNEAAKHFDESQLAALIIQIGLINFFNRVNATIRQPTGEWK